jgi:hypothetical protein
MAVLTLRYSIISNYLLPLSHFIARSIPISTAYNRPAVIGNRV